MSNRTSHDQYWKDKNVFITGGTSGLGRQLALSISELGARVGVLARSKKGIQDLIDRDDKIIGIQGDISQKEVIYPLAGELETRLGRVDVLFNVASYLGQTPLRLLVDSDCEDFEKVLQTNLLGPFRLTKALVAGMLLQEKGVVVNISSDAALNAYPKWGSYSVSKAALDQMSRVFDVELKELGVRFLSIDPGDMNTPMHFAAIPDANPQDLRDPADSAIAIHQLISSGDFSNVRRSL